MPNMPNHPKPNRVLRFLRQKGYYMVLLFCVAAVGVAGYFLVRTAVHSDARALLPEDVSVSVPVQPESRLEPEQPPDPAETYAPSEPAREAYAELVLRPVSGETVQPYRVDALCYSQTMRDWRVHEGVDLACAAGAPVRAAMAGRVSAVYDDDFLGTVVELTHADGHLTRYANLTEMPTVQTGDQVSAGQIIGAVGGTALGESAEPAHLHFAVYLNGASVDPEAFLP